MGANASAIVALERSLQVLNSWSILANFSHEAACSGSTSTYRHYYLQFGNNNYLLPPPRHISEITAIAREFGNSAKIMFLVRGWERGS